MRLSTALSLLLLLISEASSLGATARLCNSGRSNDQHFAASEVVFFGRATGQQVVPGRDDRSETETTFEVTTHWKGAPRKQIAIRTCGSPGVWCEHEFKFEPGKNYLVFASGNPLRTSMCSLTSAGANADVVVAWLKQHKF